MKRTEIETPKIQGWGGGAQAQMSSQPSLYPLPLTTKIPTLANGADLSFCAGTPEGLFFCKDDKDGRQIRAAEWFFTSLAQHVGIVTPAFAVIEDRESGQTTFGSLVVESPASDFDTRRFLSTRGQNELGQPSEWPGAYLSGLYALDMFAGNGDRGANNFMLVQDGMNRRLCAFDFASARLIGLDGRTFPGAMTATVKYGRFLRHQHGFHSSSANEMVDRIAAVPSETIAGFLKSMPEDWMGVEQREKICELWSKGRFGGRLLALRTGLADGTLL